MQPKHWTPHPCQTAGPCHRRPLRSYAVRLRPQGATDQRGGIHRHGPHESGVKALTRTWAELVTNHQTQQTSANRRQTAQTHQQGEA